MFINRQSIPPSTSFSDAGLTRFATARTFNAHEQQRAYSALSCSALTPSHPIPSCSLFFPSPSPPFATAATADDYSRAIFADDFASNAFGPRWGHYKSGSVVKDGVLVGITPQGSDHSAVDVITIPGERDLEVSVKFQFVSDKAKSFNVWLDDRGYKGSHAGHICSISVSPTSVNVADAKSGTFSNDIYERKKSPTGLTAEDKANMAKWSKAMPNVVSLKEWHTLVVRTHNDTVEVSIDTKVVGSFTSPGVAHDSKTVVSLTTNQMDVQYDDFSIKGVAK